MRSVSLSSPSALPVTVNYSTANGTAIAGGDYAAVSGTVTFDPGVTSRTILVPTIDDAVADSPESFFVNLSNGAGGVITDAQGVATIQDDDAFIPQGDSVLSASRQDRLDESIVDEFSLLLSAGQTVSLVASADEPALQLRLSLSNPGEEVVAQVEAASPGDSVRLQTVPVDNDGVYLIQVEDLLAGSGDYTLKLWINAAVEEEPITGVTNDTLATAQDVNAVFDSLIEQNPVEQAIVVGTGQASQQDVDFFASVDVPLAVGAAQVTSTLAVPEGPVIADLNVRLDVQHTFLEDLEIFLVSPQGTQIPLFRSLFGALNEHLEVTFDDQANVAIDEASSPFDGSTEYQPEGSLADFNGENAAGNWTLLVNDTFP
ncbi:MAG: proprotein convertase P-domain-containing protein, partial [Planctomycetes bacterium]|nr:proprotein convertase P-domain-containing protein [Planctomycetota bacterium]